MAGGYRVEVREPGRQPRTVTIGQSLEVGRECDGIVVEDPRASRRHLRLSSGDGRLVASDLGSTYGTLVNGARISGDTDLSPGDTLWLGDTEIVVLPPVTEVVPVVEQARAAASGPAVSGSEPNTSAPTGARPGLDELSVRETDAGVIRYRPGTAGEAAAAGMATALRRARRRLAGLGSEPWGVRPQVCLVDPFPDPARPGEVVATGALVDAAHNEIWMVVTSESPPEPPERALSLLFGAVLPAADDLATVLEGYGLHLADAPDPDSQLREMELPPLGAAEGELAGAMGLSFVRYLVERGGVDSLRRLLAEARPGRVDVTAQEVYGGSLASLEDAWRRKVAAGPTAVKPRQFLRLSLRYLQPHVRREAEMFVYMLLGLGFTVVFPFAFRRLLDTAIPSGRLSEALGILALLGGAFAVSLVANLRRAYLSAYVSAAVARQVRTEMFERLQALGAGWFGGRQQGDVLSRLFSDVSVLQRGLSEAVRDGLTQVVALLVSAVVLLLLDPLLGAIVLTGTPLVGMVYRSMAAGARKRSVAVQEQTGSVLTVASENYTAQPVVKAFGLESREVARFGRSSERLFGAQVRLQLFGGLFGLSVNMIVTALRLLVLGVGSWLILEGRLTVGGLVAFMAVMGEVLSPVTVLTGIGERLQAATGALLRIDEILGAEIEVADAHDATPLPLLEGEIRLDHVSFSYTSGLRTLEDLAVVIPAGSRAAVVGPTGAGKSSVLRLLMRLYDPDEGTVRFDGRDVRSGTLASLRGQLGVVFQETFLFDTTIRENIALGRPGATDEEIEAAAGAAELHEFITTLPRGYDTLVGEGGGRLSGGQRQRLAIARALVRDPKVLLLDEATSALDPRTERLIAATLARVGEGRTTIAVSHRLSSIANYDRIFVIAAGRLVEQGSHGELLALGGVYAGLWAEQTGSGVTAESSFDVAAALARVPLFEALAPADLAAVAGRLQAVDLGPGDTMAEGGGRLVLIRRGRARLLVPGIAGAEVPIAALGPGDAFGVAALLGAGTGAFLRAEEPVALLVVTDQALAALAADFPSVAAAMEGRGATGARPAGGRRLPRLSLTPGVGLSAVPGPATGVAPPNPEDVQRSSGSFMAVPR